MKRVLLFLIVFFVFLSGFCFWLFPKYTVPVLMYHNIGYKEGDSFFVTPENFLRQMEYIRDRGYEVITLDRLVESIKNKERIKRNKVVITFDDGYKDNFQYAYPVLKKLGFPASVFLVTNNMGKKFTQTDKEFMSWDEVKVMSENRISFGAHTKTHCELGKIINEEGVFEEISGSKKDIETRTGAAVDYFCYPGGAFSEKAKELVVKAGYKGACTTNRGYAKVHSDVYELKRIKVTNSDTNKPFSFWAKLSGYYTVFKRERNPY